MIEVTFVLNHKASLASVYNCSYKNIQIIQYTAAYWLSAFALNIHREYLVKYARLLKNSRWEALGLRGKQRGRIKINVCLDFQKRVYQNVISQQLIISKPNVLELLLCYQKNNRRLERQQNECEKM